VAGGQAFLVESLDPRGFHRVSRTGARNLRETPASKGRQGGAQPRRETVGTAPPPRKRTQCHASFGVSVLASWPQGLDLLVGLMLVFEGGAMFPAPMMAPKWPCEVEVRPGGY